MSSEAGAIDQPEARLVWPGFFYTWLGLATLACLLLVGCQAMPSERFAQARGLAEAGRMVERDIVAPPFVLRSYARIGDPASGTARLYIEGDGLAWLSRSRPSPDPTPINPVALSLARADPAPNVIWLARPCQYHLSVSGKLCPSRYWQAARFAPEAIAAMSGAIDELKRAHGLKQLELVGFSGGGAVVLLLAARRNDIISVRTVAGNLDIDAFTRLHGVSPMSVSLNPAASARRLIMVPQRHFVGTEDKVVPADIYRSYHAAAGPSATASLAMVPGASHEDGWVERWPELVAQRVP